MTGLQFDAATHTYQLNGQPVPGVTKIIEGAQRFAGVPAEMLERARARGSALHRAIELELQDNLDEDSLGPDTRACMVQFRRFRRDSIRTSWLSEQRLASKRYGYAGTLDFVGELRGDPKGVISLVDWKRASVLSPSTGLQTAAYAELLHECMPSLVPDGVQSRFTLARYALHLSPDGYKLHALRGLSDWPVFSAALTLWRWCNVHKLT